jgi:TetR/AcrR family transcriptional repressor of lmrAB and yxaGH operons
MLSTAMRLIRYQGVAATGVLQVLDEASAPRGSLYHHFPGGKSQMVAEALQLNADFVAEALNDVIDATSDAPAALALYAESLASELQQSDFRAGCPLATAVLEQAATDDTVAEIGDTAFEEWRAIISDGLRDVDKGRADELALLCVAAIEGALIIARAKRDVAPVLATAKVLGSLIESVVQL